MKIFTKIKDIKLFAPKEKVYGYADCILLFALQALGKSVGFVIANLLFWDHFVVAQDIKLENHQFTSGWRGKTGARNFCLGTFKS